MIKKIIFIVIILLVLGIVGYSIYTNNQQKENNNVNEDYSNINVYDYYDKEETVRQEEISGSNTIYLWNKENIPATTNYTKNNGNYFDDPDFVPYMTKYDVPDGTKVKGAVLINPGGAFQFRSESQEGTRVADRLTELGYISFVVHYRVRPYTMQEGALDLARAISLIFENANTLQVNTNDYSLWGGSAGARMVAYIGTHGVEYFGGGNYPKPATVIMQYTGHSEVGRDEVPTFAVVGSNDGIANPNTMKRRIQNLKSMGVDAEIKVYPNLSHGFGLGIGTSAEGWINDAIKFWEKHL